MVTMKEDLDELVNSMFIDLQGHELEHKLQGQCHEKLNELHKALQSYREAITLEPMQLDLTYHVCQLLSNHENLMLSNLGQFWCGVATHLSRHDNLIENFKTKMMNRLKDSTDLSKKLFKCMWLSIDLKNEEELILFPNKNGTVKTLLEEAAKQIEFNPAEGSGKLRILDMSGHKLLLGPCEDDSLEYLQSHGETRMTNQRTYRIEEIPRDEMNLRENELLIPVLHFYKDVYNCFGYPFYIKIKQGEQFVDVKERLQEKLGVTDEEWEKCDQFGRFCTIAQSIYTIFGIRALEQITETIQTYLSRPKFN